MKFLNKSCATILMTSGLFASTALADGVDKMYDYRGGYIDELSIIGDVTFPDGETYALFEMAEMDMLFYIPQDAAYVMIDATNPIIANQQPFEGGWISTAAPGDDRWGACPGEPVYDHNDQPRYTYGDVIWTYTGLDNYDLYFSLQLGHCEQNPEEWAYNDPSKELPPVDEAMETCGNERDNVLRALGCSNVISNPTASTADVSWALWSRAYVRCGDAPVEDIISDLMAAVRMDPVEWKEYYQRVSGYEGPMDTSIDYNLYGAVSRFANGGCR